jgi:glycogen(starch) synthase
MRILRVAQRTFPEVTGGGAYHVHAMSRDQAVMGHDVTVLTVGDRGREQRDGYTLVRRPATTEVLGNEMSAGVARYLYAKASDFDVLHAHSHLYFSTNLAAFVRRFGGPPLAVTNHGLYSQTAPERLFDAYLRTLGRWTFNQGDVVFCYTDADRERLREVGVSTRIDVVRNGIDTDRFCPSGPLDSRVTGDPALLFVGRLVEGKRPGDALAALATLRQQLSAVELTICGDGPLLSSLQDEAENLGIADATTFLGQVPYEAMPAIYRSADILVLPSRAEGFPRTVIEALASGVPVVMSDLEQVAPVVRPVGRVAPVGKPAAFAEAILDLDRSGTERTPRVVVEAEYAWSDTVAATTRSLESLIQPGNHRERG